MNVAEQTPNARLSSPTVLALFEREGGLASRAQLLALGVDDDSIPRAVRRGQLVRMHPGIFRLPGPLSNDQRLKAACLAVDGAVVSHRAAAWFHGFAGFERLRCLEVSTRFRSAAKGVWVHHVRRLPEADTDCVRGVRVTREARTLVDLCEVCSRRQVAQALDGALRKGVVRLDQLRQLVDGRPRGHKGTRLMRELLAARDGSDERTKSELETRFIHLVREAGLPEPLVNVALRDPDGSYVAEPDARWDAAGLVVFLDGWQFHSLRPEFKMDRSQANQLTRRGWRVLRYTWDDVMEDGARVVAELRTFVRPGLAVPT